MPNRNLANAPSDVVVVVISCTYCGIILTSAESDVWDVVFRSVCFSQCELWY